MSRRGTGRIEALSAERLKLAYDIDVPEEVVLVDLDTGVNSIPWTRLLAEMCSI